VCTTCNLTNDDDLIYSLRNPTNPNIRKYTNSSQIILGSGTLDIEALLDTGALHSNYISDSIATRLKYLGAVVVSELSRVCSLGDNCHMSHGFINAIIMFNNYKTQYDLIFKILLDLPYDIIIGRTDINKYDLYDLMRSDPAIENKHKTLGEVLNTITASTVVEQPKRTNAGMMDPVRRRSIPLQNNKTRLVKDITTEASMGKKGLLDTVSKDPNDVGHGMRTQQSDNLKSSEGGRGPKDERLIIEARPEVNRAHIRDLITGGIAEDESELVGDDAIDFNWETDDTLLLLCTSSPDGKHAETIFIPTQYNSCMYEMEIRIQY